MLYATYHEFQILLRQQLRRPELFVPFGAIFFSSIFIRQSTRLSRYPLTHKVFVLVAAPSCVIIETGLQQDRKCVKMLRNVDEKRMNMSINAKI